MDSIWSYSMESDRKFLKFKNHEKLNPFDFSQAFLDKPCYWSSESLSKAFLIATFFEDSNNSNLSTVFT